MTYKIGDRIVFAIDVGDSDQLPNLGNRGVIEAEDMFLAERWHIQWDKGINYHAIEKEITLESEWDKSSSAA